MDIKSLKSIIDNYNNCDTERRWTKSREMLNFENEYIKVLRIDSANKWIGSNSMIKMWSIIFSYKKSFTQLKNYSEISRVLDIEITPVQRGELKGNYGIRIRNMRKEPNAEIIKILLDYIFL
jgi:hypothetical protein